MKNTRYLVLTSLLLIVTIIQSCDLFPPKKPQSKDLIESKFLVTTVKEGGVKDLVLLDSNQQMFYINRGLENLFILEEFRASYWGEIVKIKSLPNLPHIYELTHKDSLIYSELR